MTQGTNFTPLFHLISALNREESLSSILLKCTSIQVSKTDLLPQSICNACLNRLINAYLFKELCLETHDKFEKLMAPDDNVCFVQIAINADELYESSLLATYLEADTTDNVQMKDIEDILTKNDMDFETENDNLKEYLRNFKGEQKDCSENQANKTFILEFETESVEIDMKQHGDLKELPNKTIPKKTFNCTICGKSFPKSSNLTIHVRRHTGEKPYSCDSCNLSFVCSYELKMHKFTHTKERPFVCQICSKSFTKSSAVSRHKKLHNVVRPHKCTVADCFRTFITLHGLNLHKETRHTVDSSHKQTYAEKQNFVCKVCHKIFNKQSGLSLHMQSYKCAKNVIQSSTLAPKEP